VLEEDGMEEEPPTDEVGFVELELRLDVMLEVEGLPEEVDEPLEEGDGDMNVTNNNVMMAPIVAKVIILVG
jgi:hypothetical protein